MRTRGDFMYEPFMWKRNDGTDTIALLQAWSIDYNADFKEDLSIFVKAELKSLTVQIDLD